jgi:uncharacterized protein
MQLFLFRLNSPRPTFAQDMTDTERAAMLKHVAYWRELLDEGTAIVFGPVADPKGTWGVGIVRVEDEAEARALRANDPAVKAGIGLAVEIYPMPSAVTRQ